LAGGSGALGACREPIGAVIDPAVGLTLDATIGDRVPRGEMIGRIMARTEHQLASAMTPRPKLSAGDRDPSTRRP
jgi:thymidine phosphorylase